MSNNDRREVKLPPLHEDFSFSARFSIMLILYTHEKIVFSKLQKLLDFTSGNLTHHLSVLSKSEFITIKKMLLATRPMNVIHITEKGKKSFGLYLTEFKDILEDIEI